MRAYEYALAAKSTLFGERTRTLAVPVTEGRPLPKGVRAVLYERK